MIDHYTKLYKMQVVGWFVSKELEDHETTLHFLIKDLISSLTVLITGRIDTDSCDLELKVYQPWVNKLNTCFGLFGMSALKVTNTQ